MASQTTGPAAERADDDLTRGDPWHAFSYLVAGVLLYGALGWGLDRWLGTGFLVVLGILLGVVLGLYATWARFYGPRREPSTRPPKPRTTRD